MDNATMQSLYHNIDIVIDGLTPEAQRPALKHFAHEQIMRAFAAGVAEQSRLDHNNAINQHVTRIGGYQYDALGGVAVTYFIVEAPDTETVYERLAEIGVEAQHCQHEYDCCAHWYGESPKILQTLNGHSEYLVEWRQYQNV